METIERTAPPNKASARARARRPRPPVDPTTAYAEAVVAGEILTGRLVRLACERHLRDLRTGHRRGILFDAMRAARAFKFFSLLPLIEGEQTTEVRPFVLQPWQEFIIGSIFGWITATGERRFRTAYVEIGKGNGKTPLASGVALYCLTADRQDGAEVYCAAVTRAQANIAFRDARMMAERSPFLRRRLDITTHNIADHNTDSYLRPISSERRGLDGKRVHCAVIDEIHEHPDSTVVDKISAGTKGRTNALLIEITNSGSNRYSVCYQHHDFSRQVLEGVIENDSWFAYVAQLDACADCRAEGAPSPSDGCENCDSWCDERVWPKANPNLGISIDPTYLRRQVAEAVGIPSKRNLVKRLNFCIWTESISRWISAEKWDACAAPPPHELEGRECFAGLDLSSTNDITALALWFPDEELEVELEPEKQDREDRELDPAAKPLPQVVRGGDLLAYFWCPEDNLMERARRDRVPYDQWRDAGLIYATPGNTVDQAYIRRTLQELSARYVIRELAIDTWNAAGIETALQQDGITVVRFQPHMHLYAAPTKAFEVLVRRKKLRHGGNLVLRWMAANVAVERDAHENLRPSKKHSFERIDGITAAIQALSRAMVAPVAVASYEFY